MVLFPVRVDDAVFDTMKPGRPSCALIATSATSAPGKITTPARKSSSGARRLGRVPGGGVDLLEKASDTTGDAGVNRDALAADFHRTRKLAGAPGAL